MKKLLFGTTALVGAGMLASGGAQAAEPIKVTTYGWVNEYMGVVDVDEPSGSTADFNGGASHLDAQVNFKGSTTLDNGLEAGFRIEIEIPAPASKDEVFVYLKGDFGEIRGGNHNSAGYAMLSGVPGVGVPINSGWISSFIPPVTGFNNQFRSVAVSSKIDFSNDDNTVLYFTPNFSGFQLGVSYTPNASKGNDASGNTDTSGTAYHNGVAIAGTFNESFNGVGINIGASYGRAEAGDGTKALSGGDDIEQVNVSGRVSVSGFTIGGAYASQIEGRTVFDSDSGVTSTNEGESWGVGVTYSTGPWTVGVDYFNGEIEDVIATAGEDELNAVSGGISYALGPGITADFTVLWAEFEDEAGPDQSGFAGIVGFSVGF